MIHRERPFHGFSFLSINPQRCAERSARVSSRRLNPYLLEWTMVAQVRVHDTVKRNTSCHAESVESGLSVQPLGQLQDCFLQDNLQGMCYVEMVFSEFVSTLSRGSKHLSKVNIIDGVLSVVNHVNDTSELIGKNWLAIGRECHHLVLVRRVKKSQVGGHALIQ